MAELTCHDLGQMCYDEALAVQERLAAKLAADPAAAPQLLLVEHAPPVITMGRSAQGRHVLASAEQLSAAGVQVRQASRGGDVTWHGPGQIVAYPVVRLDPRVRGLRQYLRDLEEAVIRVLARFGIEGRRINGLTGVWVGEAKIAAIGVAVRKWVTYHGLALNVGPDLSGFELIVPCGLRGRAITSLSILLGRQVTLDEVKPLLAEELIAVLGDSPAQAAPQRVLPPWMRKRLPPPGQSGRVLATLDELGLSTVCREARCPNQAECHARGTATFLILGDRCTRSCGFCAIGQGQAQRPRADEPEAVAQAAARLGLRHVVVTSVTRDDLSDGGAEHFARTIRAIRVAAPQAAVEVLTSDFAGNAAALAAVLAARPDVFNHNVETVPRLYPRVRPQGEYSRSLALLAAAAAWRGSAGEEPPAVKSGLMVGLGENDDEVDAVLRDLRDSGCKTVTVGQYLAPTDRHLPVARYVTPERFDRWRQLGNELGLQAVLAGTYVRSSYRAEMVRQGISGTGGSGERRSAR